MGERVEEESAPEIVRPGSVSGEELGVLYSAAQIELRAARENLAAVGSFVTAVMQLLEVDTPDAALEKIAAQMKNRATRRAAARPSGANKKRATKAGRSKKGR